MQFKQVNLTRAYQQIVEQVQEGIHSGELASGEKLPTEQELIRTFGVSRAAVRDAMRVLDTLGLVEVRQGSGVYVRNDTIPAMSRALSLSVAPSPESVQRLFEFRRLLETPAVRLAAERRTDAHVENIRRRAADTSAAAVLGDFEAFAEADESYHSAIGEAAGNPYLANVLNAVREMQRDVVRLVIQSPGSPPLAAEQHARIAEAIADGEPDRAADLMRQHIDYSEGVAASAVADVRASRTRFRSEGDRDAR